MLHFQTVAWMNITRDITCKEEESEDLLFLMFSRFWTMHNCTMYQWALVLCYRMSILVCRLTAGGDIGQGVHGVAEHWVLDPVDVPFLVKDAFDGADQAVGLDLIALQTKADRSALSNTELVNLIVNADIHINLAGVKHIINQVKFLHIRKSWKIDKKQNIDRESDWTEKMSHRIYLLRRK